MNFHTIESLAEISDAALSAAYGYPRSIPGRNFGWQANLQSVQAAMRLIVNGVRDIEQISDAIHEAWNVTALADYHGSLVLDEPTSQEKKDRRYKLAMKKYAELDEDEKEKDRVVARVVLAALLGE